MMSEVSQVGPWLGLHEKIPSSGGAEDSLQVLLGVLCTAIAMLAPSSMTYWLTEIGGPAHVPF